MKKTHVLKQFLAMIWKIQPRYFLWLAGGSLITTANTLLSIWIPKRLIDLWLAQGQFGVLLREIIVLLLIKFCLTQLNRWMMIALQQHREILQERILWTFSQKIMDVPYEFLERASYLDLKERALFAVVNYGALQSIFEQSLIFTTSVLTFISMVGILWLFHPLFLLAILILCIITLVISGRLVNKTSRKMQEIIPINRSYQYYISTALDQRHQKEFRIYDMSSLLEHQVGTLDKHTSRWQHDLNTMQGNSLSLQILISYLLRFITYGYISLRVISQQFGAQISLGDFTVYVNASESVANSFRSMIESLIMINQCIGYLEPFASFMALETDQDRSGKRILETIETLEFDHVFFAYPQSEHTILHDMSFTIKKGERISIVGLNNAGKSTIVKLIMRLFTPSEGEIRINGYPINTYDYASYMKRISAIFQDFKLFPFSIQENICAAQTDIDEALLSHVIEETKLSSVLARTPHGINSYLNKNIHPDGVDFSGGEQQKIAIARSLYKQADLIILDEPTAALDPLAESEIYENFNQMITDKTAIFISHRMSSSLFCDKILLIQDGQAVAFAPHQQMMQESPQYRELFESQAQHYR